MTINILVTRPADQAQALCELLHAASANAYAFPTIEIEAERSYALEKCIKKFDVFDIIIFTSVNAVKHSVPLIKQYWPLLPAQIRFAAIGNSTKNAIEQQGWICHIFPKTAYSSEALLQTDEMQALTGKAVLILTGKDGLDHLAENLQARKNAVKIATCYQRIVPNYTASAIMNLEKNNFDFIVCTSNESLKNLSLILSKRTLKKFQDAQIIAFSPRINTLAKSLGFTKQPIIATPASDAAIVAAITQCKRKIMTASTNPKEIKPAIKITEPPKSIEAPKPNAFVAIIAIVIAVLALIEGAYLNNTVRLLHSNADKTSQQATTALSNQSQQLTELSNQLKQLQAENAKNNQQISDNQAALQSLQDIKFLNNTHWTLAEIKYLLTVAQYNLKLTNSPATALVILEKIDNQLQQLNNPRVLSLRQQVITAITQLKALPVIDYAGALMQLNVVSEQLKQMPLLVNTANGTEQNFVSPVATTGWRKYWNASLTALEKLVVIRHQDQSIEPLITPKEQQFLEENIQAKLSQASWALLRHNQSVYELSLQQALNWIQTYYMPNTPSFNGTVDSLQSLMKIDLSQELPDLSSAIDLTNNILKTSGNAPANNVNTTVKGAH